jgi:O-antigen ligase
VKLGSTVLFDRVAWWAWLALLVAIPVTSFPWVEATIGGETVSPLSLLPLLLLIAWLARHLRRGGSLPSAVQPLLLFAMLAAVSSAASLLLPLGPYKGQTVLTRSFHGMATLAVGLCFYLCATLLPSGPDRLRSSLRAIYAGGILTLLWSSIQATYVLRHIRQIPLGLNEIHRLFSVRDLFANRVTGLAYEPSWLGDQLVVLYLPLWLASIATGYSVTRRWGKLPVVELGLATWGLVILLLAESRISIAAMLMTLGMLGAWALWRLAGRLVVRISTATQRSSPLTGILPRMIVLGLGLVVFVLLVEAVLGLSATTDWRIRRVFSLPEEIATLRAEYPFELGYAIADQTAFAERVVYWRAGFSAFERYPVLGVGLGNAGFVFEDGLPTFGYRLEEIRRVLNPENLSFPNSKSLWIRLLAETGFVGTSAFLTWTVLMLGAACALARTTAVETRLAGVAALLALPAWILEGFSLDTFALPQTWILLGLLTAAAWKKRPSDTAGKPAAVGLLSGPPSGRQALA